MREARYEQRFYSFYYYYYFYILLLKKKRLFAFAEQSPTYNEEELKMENGKQGDKWRKERISKRK